MPEASDNKTLLAGHAPATIVGGKRVGQSKNHHEANSTAKPREQHNSESNDEKIEKTVQPTVNAGSLVSGEEIRIEDAYPTQAVRSFHEKPLPTHDKMDHFKPTGNIYQPRK